jgi:NAD(P)-dependent dehydrogenase (short-subunit alcohol dehydrogenase family)
VLIKRIPGINFSFAQLLLSKGCNVAIADLSLRPEAEALVSRHADKAVVPRAIFIKTDVTCWPDLNRMFEVTVSEFGGFDIVCPGAGVYEPHWSNFWQPPGSPESNDDIQGGRYALLDINLTHPIRTTQLALQYWLNPPIAGVAAASVDNPKRVVLISSIAAQIPVFKTPLYAASKYAISGFTRCLADLEPRLGVRVTAVAPGIVKTPLWTEHPEKLLNIDPEKDGWVTPEQVANVMLSSMEKDTVTGGTVIEVAKNRTRAVQVYNDPGPDFTPGNAIVASRWADGDEIVWDWLDDKGIWAVHDWGNE